MDSKPDNLKRDGNPKPRHISRLRAEMRQLSGQYNPWDSPVSSTGTRDTVSTTEEFTASLSNLSFNPDAEGTRKFGEDTEAGLRTPHAKSNRTGKRPRTIINTSALGRVFPEWNGLDRINGAVNNNHKITLSRAVSLESIDTASTSVAAEQQKENIPPPLVDGTDTENTYDNTFDVKGKGKGKRTRADMQPTVENESDCSSVLSSTPLQPLSSRRSRFARSQDAGGSDKRQAEAAGNKAHVHDLVAKMRRQMEDAENLPLGKTAAITTTTTTTTTPAPVRAVPSHLNNAKQQPFTTPATAAGVHNKSGPSPTGRSFFLPNLRFLPDWTSGTLKFSTMRNGIPVFVKSSKVRTLLGQPLAEHGTVREVNLPEEDEEIFVSLDKLQDEVRELHDHDAMLQREAEKLQQEVTQLQTELRKFKVRKRSDSALGSDSDNSLNKRAGSPGGDELETVVAQLQERLDEASNQLAVNNIHNTSLTAERDVALKQASAARDSCKQLQADIERILQELDSARRHLNQTQTENTKLRANHATISGSTKELVDACDLATNQYQQIFQDYKELDQQLTSTRQELAKAQKELKALRSQHQTLLEEKEQMSQELEFTRNNLASIRAELSATREELANTRDENAALLEQNEALQTELDGRDQRVAKLEKKVTKRDREIEALRSSTMPSANEQLRKQADEHARAVSVKEGELLEKSRTIQEKQNKIYALKDENVVLSRENRSLVEENQRLAAEVERLRDQSTEDRNTLAEVNQMLIQNATEQTRTLLRLEEEHKQREEATNHKLDRQQAALKEIKHLAKLITEFRDVTVTTTSRTANAARLTVDPAHRAQARAQVQAQAQAQGRESRQSMTENITAQTNAANVDDDPTTEINMTEESQTQEESNYSSILGDQIPKLRAVLNDLHNELQGNVPTEVGPAGDTIQTDDITLPTLPGAQGIRRTQSDDTISAPKGNAQQSGKTQTQPNGILRWPGKLQEDNMTGRLSMRSAMTGRSSETEGGSIDVTTTHGQRAARSASDAQLRDNTTRPSVRFLHRRHTSEGYEMVEADDDTTEDQDMCTSDAQKINVPGPVRFAQEPRESVSTKTIAATTTNMTRTERFQQQQQQQQHRRQTSAATTATMSTEQNMTSAFFVPDITLQAEGVLDDEDEEAGPSLSKDARRVLDRVCKHNSGNCTVCTRISAYGQRRTHTSSSKNNNSNHNHNQTHNKVNAGGNSGSKDNNKGKDKVPASSVKKAAPSSSKDNSKKSSSKGKVTVRVERPVPVSDRHDAAEVVGQEKKKNDDGGEGEENAAADATMRPAQPPSEALAYVIKETKDMVAHLEMRAQREQAEYLSLNKTRDDRLHRAAFERVRATYRALEGKRKLLYRLYDVLEGQKQAGQMMVDEEVEVDVTVVSGTSVGEDDGSRRPEIDIDDMSVVSWDGFD